jgi:hypothetical protein
MYRPKFSVWFVYGSTADRRSNGAITFWCLRGMAVARYLKLGFGGAHTESNQRLMYTSA